MSSRVLSLRELATKIFEVEGSRTITKNSNCINMASATPLPYALEVSPESALQFTITRDPPSNDVGEGASRCTMTLRHPGLTQEHLAFKVGNEKRWMDYEANESLSSRGNQMLIIFRIYCCRCSSTEPFIDRENIA